MVERAKSAAVLGCIALIGLLLGAGGPAARAQETGRQDLSVLMADAQAGVSEAQYQLGQHYEAQYDLGRQDPDFAGDHTNLLLAFAWFRSAEESGHQNARYARIAAEYALRNVYDDDQFRQAMDSVQEWMKDQRPAVAVSSLASPPETSQASPPETSLPSLPPPAEPAGAIVADDAIEQPPEASATLAAGGEDGGTESRAAPPPDKAPDQDTNQTANQTASRQAGRDPEARALAAAPSDDPPSDPVATVPGPDIEDLMARGMTYLEAGDLVAARGFFKMAAGRGSGEAAMLVGITYDPGYMELVKVVGLRPNAEQAEAWYLKAIAMDHAEAETRLQALKQRLDPQAQFRVPRP